MSNPKADLPGIRTIQRTSKRLKAAYVISALVGFVGLGILLFSFGIHQDKGELTQRLTGAFGLAVIFAGVFGAGIVKILIWWHHE